MKNISTLPKIGAILLFIISIASCDEAFNTIGTDIIGNEDLLTSTHNSSTVISYSKKLDPVQTNLLPVNQLGVYNDPVFGKSSVNYLTQLVLEETDPTFGDTVGHIINLESVILYLPYFIETTIEDDEDPTYELDSVFGNTPVKLSIFESNFFLRDSDPNSNFEDPQPYYSNQASDIEAFLGEELLVIEDFIPSNEGFVLTEGEGEDEVKTFISPGIRVELPLDFFREKILDQEKEPVLNNNNNFKEYFRGIYFKIESATDDGNLFIFDPDKANITLNYNFDRLKVDDLGEPILDEETGEEIIDVIEETYVLDIGGVDLNTFDNNVPSSILNQIENPNTTQGEETLYVRGGEGILTVINLFGDDFEDDETPSELEDLRDKNWIINDANLKFYVNQNIVSGGSTEPERLIIYNLETNNILADYFLDNTSGSEPVDAITNHLGRLQRDSDGNGEFYKIRLTNHLSNLINKDSTNVPLGLIVSQNVLISGFQVIDSLTNPDTQLPRIKVVPSSSVFSPEGTVFYGNNTVNEEKRLRLELKYIDPNN
ncbi:MAG: DUF4270 domain-containing protein [Flavobacteriaceae bacterium]